MVYYLQNVLSQILSKTRVSRGWGGGGGVCVWGGGGGGVRKPRWTIACGDYF